jgi:transposase
MGRRVFTREFKLEAVKLVKESSSDRANAFPGRGQMKPEDAEIARLKRELAKTKAERDILKKTIGFFVKDPT